jgi:hypothetical protein
MRRRQFLRGVGAAAAGVASAASCVTPARSRRDDSLYRFAFQRSRAAGRPMMLVSVGCEDDRLSVLAAKEAIRTGTDHELAVRQVLVAAGPMSDDGLLQAITNERPKFDPPSIVWVDGEPPRVIKQAQLDRAKLRAGFEQFLRENVSLDLGWLQPRVALLERHVPDVVKEVRARMAAGEPTGILGVRAAAVVVLEALRRTGAAREALIAELLAAASSLARPPQPDDVDIRTFL